MPASPRGKLFGVWKSVGWRAAGRRPYGFYRWCAEKPPLLGEVAELQRSRKGFRSLRKPLSQKSEIFDSSPNRGALGVWKSGGSLGRMEVDNTFPRGEGGPAIAGSDEEWRDVTIWFAVR